MTEHLSYLKYVKLFIVNQFKKNYCVSNFALKAEAFMYKIKYLSIYINNKSLKLITHLHKIQGISNNIGILVFTLNTITNDIH